MQIKVPYFAQTEEYTCGPEVLRMISAFFGTQLDVKKAEKVLNTTQEHGTNNEDMVKGAKKLGFKVVAKENASVEDIRNFIKKGIPVVVNFVEPTDEVGHHSLVVGINDKEITLNDPTHGEGFVIPIREFEARWKSGFENYERWMMAVSPKISFKDYFRSISRLSRGQSYAPVPVKVHSDSPGEQE